MPELPEVETMVRDLERQVVGRTIIAVDLPFPGAVRYPEPAELVQRASGATIAGVMRRGKYAGLLLDGGDLLVLHRGMSGSLLLRSPDAPLESHVRVMLTLDNSRQLRFNDPRKFGKVYVMAASGVERPLPWSRMGPEPLERGFTARVLGERLAPRTAPIKPLLLGQALVAGLGNIYADEALHRARVHPLRRANALSEADVRRLHRAIGAVLREAIARRGTTFSNYTDLEGRAGGYQESLRVFGRQGTPCASCGTPIVKLVVGGRGTHVCPRCQPAPAEA